MKAPRARLRPASSVSQLGQPGQTEGHQQKVEDEQLFAFAPRHQREPPAHEALPAGQQQGNQHGGFQAGNQQGGEQFFRGGTKRRNQHQQRHHSQILKEQHTHDTLAVLGFDFQPVGHEFDDDGGAAHGHGA